MLRAPPLVAGRVIQLDSLYFVLMLGVSLLNLMGGPVSPFTVRGMPKSKFVAFLHSLSGKLNRLAYGTSVLHVGAALELVSVTVTVLAEGLKVIVPVVVTTLVLAGRVLVVVLVQNSVLLQPVGQR